ncbi:hypothetical protein C8241_03100 [Paracidovorax avenae]|nr:hypothetical protein C8241_03100 [Paracidovorax avenae]
MHRPAGMLLWICKMLCIGCEKTASALLPGPRLQPVSRKRRDGPGPSQVLIGWERAEPFGERVEVVDGEQPL